jgi:hypothetical protein
MDFPAIPMRKFRVIFASFPKNENTSRPFRSSSKLIGFKMFRDWSYLISKKCAEEEICLMKKMELTIL